MNTLNASIDSLPEPKREAQQIDDTYRAPRLVTLGTTVRLVQGSSGYQRWDGGRGYYS
jgi:hypothetical protein